MLQDVSQIAKLFSGYEGVFVVFYFWSGGLAEDDGDYVEAKRAVVDIVCGQEEAGGSGVFVFLCGVDDGFGGLKTLVGPCFHLDKDNRAVCVDHDKIDFAGFAGEVSGEGFEAFPFEESLAASFAPSAEQLAVG
jgi:hypothetical protein